MLRLLSLAYRQGIGISLGRLYRDTQGDSRAACHERSLSGGGVRRHKAHSTILQYVQGEGQEKAIAYIDKLVAEGKLGAKNAEKLKEALPKGIKKLKEVMGEIEKEEASK